MSKHLSVKIFVTLFALLICFAAIGVSSAESLPLPEPYIAVYDGGDGTVPNRTIPYNYRYSQEFTQRLQVHFGNRGPGVIKNAQVNCQSNIYFDEIQLDLKSTDVVPTSFKPAGRPAPTAPDAVNSVYFPKPGEVRPNIRASQSFFVQFRAKVTENYDGYAEIVCRLRGTTLRASGEEVTGILGTAKIIIQGN
jgi:hypothetical protein